MRGSVQAAARIEDVIEMCPVRVADVKLLSLKGFQGFLMAMRDGILYESFPWSLLSWISTRINRNSTVVVVFFESGPC